MASPLQSEDVQSTFLPFFGMTRSPFSWPPAPAEIFRSDQSALLDSHLTAATQRADSLVVVFGADGIGKTTLLNEFTEGLGDDVCYAAFDETCVEGIQFFRSFLEQMGLGEIVGTLRELQHITSEYLVHRGKSGQHALILVDNAHLVRPAVLEQLRWMAAVRVDFARAVSMVLAGNLSLQRVMDSPAMCSLRFCRQTNFHIRAYSQGETGEYIRHRLNLAGAPDSVKFSDESRALIYRFTGGNPAKINALCHAVLGEACVQGTRNITEQRVRAVAEAGKMLPHAVPIRGKGRRKNDVESSPLTSDSNSSERIASRQCDLLFPERESAGASLLHEAEIKALLARIAELSGQLENKASEEKRHALIEARKHEKVADELRAQLAERAELTAKLSRSLEEKDRDLSRLNAALSDSVRLRRDAEEFRQSLADELVALQGRLDAGSKEAEMLTATLKKHQQEIDSLALALARSKAALPDRDRVIADLRAQLAAQASEMSDLRAAVASRAAEVAVLSESLSLSRKLAYQDKKASQETTADPKRLRHSTRRTGSMRRSSRRWGEVRDEPLEKTLKEHAAARGSREKPANLERAVEGQGHTVAGPAVVPDSVAAGTGETKTLLPDQMPNVRTGEFAAVHAHGDAMHIELFVDGKPWKVVDFAGKPPRMTIGRAEDCDLRLDSKYVSRHHAMIVHTENSIAIEDLHSANGIFVNSEKVERFNLRPGDKVAIGNFTLRLRRG